MTIKDNTANVVLFREVKNPFVLWMKTEVSYSEDQLDSFNAVDLTDGR